MFLRDAGHVPLGEARDSRAVPVRDVELLEPELPISREFGSAFAGCVGSFSSSFEFRLLLGQPNAILLEYRVVRA